MAGLSREGAGVGESGSAAPAPRAAPSQLPAPRDLGAAAEPVRAAPPATAGPAARQALSMGVGKGGAALPAPGEGVALAVTLTLPPVPCFTEDRAAAEGYSGKYYKPQTGGGRFSLVPEGMAGQGRVQCRAAATPLQCWPKRRETQSTLKAPQAPVILFLQYKPVVLVRTQCKISCNKNDIKL